MTNRATFFGRSGLNSQMGNGNRRKTEIETPFTSLLHTSSPYISIHSRHPPPAYAPHILPIKTLSRIPEPASVSLSTTHAQSKSTLRPITIALQPSTVEEGKERSMIGRERDRKRERKRRKSLGFDLGLSVGGHSSLGLLLV